MVSFAGHADTQGVCQTTLEELAAQDFSFFPRGERGKKNSVLNSFFLIFSFLCHPVTITNVHVYQ